jgi:hypothetical protein
MAGCGLCLRDREARRLILFSRVQSNLQEKPFSEFFASAGLTVQIALHYRIRKQTLETGDLDKDVYGFHGHLSDMRIASLKYNL